MTLAVAFDAREVFEFDEAIRSAMVVDRIGNVVSFASRSAKPVDPIFVRDAASKWVALFGGMMRGAEESYGILKWIHLRFRKLHLYCWPVDGGYLVFTSRSMLKDALLQEIGTSTVARSRYADKWGTNGSDG